MNIYFGSMASPPQGGHIPMSRAPKVSNQPPSQPSPQVKPQTALLALLSGQNNVNEEEHVSTPINVVLRRSSAASPWGFRLQGGSDYKLQLTVCKNFRARRLVFRPASRLIESLSSNVGMTNRFPPVYETVLAVNSILLIVKATEKIRSSGTDLKMTISRRAREDLSDLRPKGQIKFNAPQHGKH
ncbi:PDZ and LIM domain protein 2 [Paragonimus heterotremus]|uniref:PDZ and LIM domain protein 2 n=1 Tax=Paragonimus heterotremus TaxID=100268 RepID=A0A8J4WP38_9TREM|nr:PDZ and LIM domain protein 2 [Paragonimus heterotremus]